MSTKASWPAPGSRPARLASSARNSRLTLPSWQTFPQLNERRNDPSVDGARTPSKITRIAPCRSTSMSPTGSAPAAIPATRHPILASALAPHGPATLTCSRAKANRPARPASDMTGTSPARDTRFGSSNEGEIFSGSCDNRT